MPKSTLRRIASALNRRVGGYLSRPYRRLLTDVINNISLGVVAFDEDERIVVCNNKYLLLYNLLPDHIRGCSFRQLIQLRKLRGTFDGDVDAYCFNISNNIAQGKACQALTKTPDGRAIQIINHPLPGGGWVATHEDITERQIAEQERDNSRKFLDLIVEVVPVSLIVKDVESRKYTLLNKAAEKLWGISREKALGRTAYDIFIKETADRITAHDLRTIVGEAGGSDLTHEIITPANGERTVLAKKLVLRGNDGCPQFLLSVIQDVTASTKDSERVRYMAHHDLLTGLGNRALFMEKIENELRQLKSDGTRFAVFMLDLDRFKEVNDTLGHAAGDDLLKEAAARLKHSVGKTDVLARLGGDEFAIIQRSMDVPIRDATVLAERLVDAFSQAFELEGSNVAIGVSIGISLAPCDGDNAGDLIKKSDLALYQKKSEGRNGYSFFDPKLAANAEQRHILERDLRAAITQDKLQAYFQPIIDMRTQTLRGFEALARWPHPTKGFVPPEQFIPLAEDTGLIAAIGNAILQKACTAAMEWPPHIKLAVNISPLQLTKPDFINIVMCVLVETGLPPERLELELTEGVLIENHLSVIPVIKQLKKLGIAIVLDDFGTGYSSLNYLTRFPFDKIKIDRSFTQNLTRKSECAAIVSAVMAIAYSLDITVVAEGVETEQQLELLRAAGVQAVQGYLFGRPEPAEALKFDYSRIVERQFAS
jgi:diguanylate cyclase (GGDEF)-like protein/PAS domain S-box-containing protein